MKRKTKNWITLLLASACVGVCATTKLAADTRTVAEETTAKTYALSDVFTTTGSVDGKKITDGDENPTYTYISLANGQSASLKRDLAFKWMKGKDEAAYLSMEFTFEALNFKKVTLAFESATSVANEDNKAVNSIEFTTDGTKLNAVVKNADNADTATSIDVSNSTDAKKVKIALKKGSTLDSFKVVINNDDDEALADEFTNVGANFAEYTTSDDAITPLKITAETEGEEKAGVFVENINGQGFTLTEEKELTDDAAPVLVLNEQISSFALGTAFALEYTVVDVLQTSSITETKKYYQYNPTDTLTDGKPAYKELSTSVYFMDTVYYTNGTDLKAEATEGYRATSVWKEEGKEFVSILFTLKDSSGKENPDIDLAWYASSVGVPSLGDAATAANYIVINKNQIGPKYKDIDSQDGTGNVVANQEAFDTKIEQYQEKVDAKAADVFAGSNATIYFPSMEDFIEDDGDFRSLKFTICYRTPSSSSATSTSKLSYNGLKLSTTKPGTYEFKVIAHDASGNAMKYCIDGEEVEVTSTNVWDIDEIPSFTFTVKNQGLKVNDPTTGTDRKAEKILDQTYTLSGITVVGATSEKSAYKLYRLDTTGYSGSVALTETALSSITYKQIAEQVATRKAASDTYDGDACFDYLDIYAELLAATAEGGDKNAIKACFKEIQEYNANITEDDEEWEAYNKYNWNPSSKSFTTVEEGTYLIVADFWEDALPTARAGAYKLVVVESEADVIKGESKAMAWVKNNVLSVVLFSIAGVMLIAIVVLLFVKPSDETLEDLDKKSVKKNKKKE